MLARLNDATRAHHGQADALRLAPLVTPTSVVGYASFLARIFGFEVPLEGALAETPDVMRLLDSSGCRAQWIHHDLVALGIEPERAARLTRCARANAFASVAQALGWLYVMERNSTLNGIVKRHLARRMPGQIEVASRYLTSTEVLAASRWRTLGTVLDMVGRRATAAEEIIEAAHAAFRAQQCRLAHAPSQDSAHDRAI